jgi:phosphoadenosine phosphosulfate reductase
VPTVQGQNLSCHATLEKSGLTGSLRWCPECNVPLLGERCDNCKSRAYEVKLRPGADPRPAFEEDLRVIREAITNDYGGDVVSVLIKEGRQTVLAGLNYLDQAYEVVQDGVSIGRAFFDIYTLSWRFKPLAQGCARLWHEAGIGAVVHGVVLKEDEVLSKSCYRTSFVARHGAFVPLVNKDDVVGLGKLLPEGLLVVRLWDRAAVAVHGRSASFEDVVSANRQHLAISESRACKFLAQLYARLRRPVVVSYSGGKDSLATLLIALRSGLEPTLFFNDTGLELPETVENVEDVKSRLGLKLLVANAGRSFWEYFSSFGPPARDYRWCCKVCKLIPTSKALLSCGEVLSLVGQRKLESSARARSQRVWRNQWIRSALVTSPIDDWSMLQVWLYISMSGKAGLVNRLYFRGLDRIGCFMCPACRIAEFETVKRLHPDLWDEWEVALRSWAASRSLPEGWLTYHLWRWTRLPKGIASFTRSLGLDVDSPGAVGQRINLKATSIEREGAHVKISFNKPVPLDVLRNIAPSAGEVRVNSDFVEIEGGGFKARIAGEGFAYIDVPMGADAEPALDMVASLVVRSTLCRGCGSCASWCPVGAVSMVSNRPLVDGRFCMRCTRGRCIERCPVVSFFAFTRPPGAGRQIACDVQRTSGAGGN